MKLRKRLQKHPTRSRRSQMPDNAGVGRQNMLSEHSVEDLKELARRSATDQAVIAMRHGLADFTALTFTEVGQELHATGNIFGTDRRDGLSPFGNGSDEMVAVSLLFRIAGQLTSAISDLFRDSRAYAAAALVRQMVEIEYLSWAFQARDKDAELWLRSTREERESFFSPRKLRAAANGKFRSKDYGYHCELGGHPVPGSALLLGKDSVASQLLLSDLLGHTGRIWDNFLRWSHGNDFAFSIHRRRETMHERYTAWKSQDALANLPPPP